MDNLASPGLGILVLFVGIVVLGIGYQARRAEDRRRAGLGEKIALIEERVRYSQLSQVASVALALITAFLVLGIVGDNSAIRTAGYGTFLTASAVILGIVIMCGRRRSYEVYRGPEEKREPR